MAYGRYRPQDLALQGDQILGLMVPSLEGENLNSLKLAGVNAQKLVNLGVSCLDNGLDSLLSLLGICRGSQCSARKEGF